MNTDPNPPATSDPETYSVSRTIHIEATQERVWAAVTEPEHLAKWARSKASMDRLEVGGTGMWTFERYGEVPIEIEAYDPPNSVTYRWGSPSSPLIDPVVSTVFTFTLEPVDAGTQLTVVESGFQNLDDPAARMEANRGGWTWGLDALVAYLAGGAS